MIRPKCKTLNPCKYRVPLYGECGYQGFCQYKTNGRKNMKEYTVRVYDSKTEWYLNNKLHREGGLPAIEWANGDKSWYMNDKLHRVDGPAIECANGNKHWWLNNKRHRTDGPAVEYIGNHKEWFICGKLHRTDGPAMIWSDGTKFWYIKGILHRIDGPAIERLNGHNEWYIEGKQYTEQEFNDQKLKQRLIPPEMWEI